MINVRRHGAIGDYTHDDTPAFISAISEMAGIDTTLYIPAGTYRITQPLFMVSGGSIKGDGPGITWLVWDSGSGITFTATANDQEFLDVSGISLRTSGAGGTALTADFRAQIQAGTTVGRFPQRFAITDCTFWPAVVGANQGWGLSIDVIAGLNGTITRCNAFGRLGDFVGETLRVPASGTTGFRFRGSAPGVFENGHPVAFVLRDCWLEYQENSIVFEGCEGGFVAGCNIVGVTNGIIWDSSSSSPIMQRPQLNVSSSHINCASTGIAAIDVADATITSTLFYAFLPVGEPPATGIRLYGDSGALAPAITENTFAGSGQIIHGISIERGSYGVISDNIFRGTIGTAINLGAASDHFKGSNNVFAPATATPVINSGTSNTVS